MILNTADAHDFIDQLTLEGVPWHRLTTPYGRGDELPKLLNALSSLRSQESVDSTVRKISHLIEHQGTLWHVTPFATVFLARIFKNSLAAATTNPVAHQAVDHIGELFAVLLESIRDAQTLEHADPLPKFSDLLTEDSLWPDDEEDDELRWEEEWDEGTKNGPDRSAQLGHNFVYQETKSHGFYSSYFHQRISS